MLTQAIGKNSLILGAFALVTAGVLALTFKGTEPRIIEAQKHAAEKALLEVFPANLHDNDLISDTWQVPEDQQKVLNIGKEATLYIARKDGHYTGAILPTVAKDGYSGDIRLIIGVDADGAITGVRVLAHKETPGLGDNIELAKSPWVLSFNGKSLSNPSPDKWKVKKDGGEFDQFTGATITPRAVVKAVKNALDYYAKHANEFSSTQ